MVVTRLSHGGHKVWGCEEEGHIRKVVQWNPLNTKLMQGTDEKCSCYQNFMLSGQLGILGH